MKLDAYRLNKPEIESKAWEKVSKCIEARLAAHRIVTENPDVDERDRLGAAWRIRELKELLKLAEPAKEQRDA